MDFVGQPTSTPFTGLGVARPRDAWHAAMAAFAVCVSLGSFASAPGLAAQEPDRDTTRFRVTLHLHDVATNRALPGALIELSGHSRRYVTGVGGQVSVEVPAGRYTLTANKGGYTTLHGSFRVVREGDLRVMLRELVDVDTSIPSRLLVRVSEFGSGRLMQGASVSVPGEQARLSDGQGWVEFRDLSGPVAEVTVEGLGYETRTDPVSLHEGRTTVVEVAMAIEALVLAPLEVEVESGFLEKQGVYWRIDRGWPTKVLTREELMERAKPRLADAFRHLPGVRVDYQGPLAVLMTHMGCVTPVYLDGHHLGLNVVGLNIDDILAEEVELAEYYEPGKVPARFGGSDPRNCGVVLLWSRRRAGKG